jgi:hypothetical protein
MSYIRCTSNPENLYVWSDGDNVHWNFGIDPDDELLMPQGVFDGLMNQASVWLGGTGVEYDGAKLYEFLEDKPIEKWVEEGSHPDNCKIILEYNNRKIRMWRVTYCYILSNFERNSARYHIREAYWYLCRLIPWWVNPRYWFSG